MPIFQRTPFPQPVQVRVPMLSRPIGAGDLIRQLTQAAGIQKPCGGCQARQAALNARLQFIPRGR